MLKAIRNNIVVGLILVTPLVITVLVANWLFRTVTNLLLNFFPRAVRDSDLELAFRFLSLLIVVIVLFLIGVLVRNIIGRTLYNLSDTLLTRTPVVNRIYLASRQVIDAFVTQRETVFNEVVLVEYPRKGIRSIGFVTASVPPSYRERIPEGDPGEPMVAVFIPTTPNPTSGWLALVPRSEVIPLAMSSGDAMKLIVSAGVVYPGDNPAEPPPSLLQKLQDLVYRDKPPPPESAPS